MEHDGVRRVRSCLGSDRVGAVRSAQCAGQSPPGWLASSLLLAERSGPKVPIGVDRGLIRLQRPGGDSAPQRGRPHAGPAMVRGDLRSQPVIEQFGEKVAKLPKDEPGTDPSGEPFYSGRSRVLPPFLADMPPEAREISRNRVDGVAEHGFVRVRANATRSCSAGLSTRRSPVVG